MMMIIFGGGFSSHPAHIHTYTNAYMGCDVFDDIAYIPF